MHRRAFSRALITVITCSIIFSYVVLRPQAETVSSSFSFPVVVSTMFNELPGDVLDSFPVYDYMGKSLYENLPFTPSLIYEYDPTAFSSSVKYFTFDSFFDPPCTSLTYLEFSFVFPLDRAPQSESYDPVLPQQLFFYGSDFTGGTDGQQVSCVYSISYDTFVDDFTGVTLYVFNARCIVQGFFPDGLVGGINSYVEIPIYTAGADVSYDRALLVFSDVHVEGLFDNNAVLNNKLDNILNNIVSNGETLVSIQNTLTNVTPEMQVSINKLENLLQDEKEKIDDVITEMDKIDTDFGTQIGDFDDILNDNAGTLEDIGSTTYNSFINDVFGNWFFVSMFALFGAFAFFSRAVFG